MYESYYHLKVSVNVIILIKKYITKNVDIKETIMIINGFKLSH